VILNPSITNDYQAFINKKVMKKNIKANTQVCIRQCRIWVSLLVCLVVNITVFGQEVKLPDATDLSEHGITEADLSGLDKIMTDFINTGTISGCSFLVAHKGEVVYRRAHGKFTTDEQVPLASVSKPFAASAIMALVDQGKLDLEKPVEDYLPEFEGIKIESTGELATPKFTTRHLLSHMAGFWGNKKITPEKLALIRDFSQTLEESVLGAAQYDLIHNPGSKWTYSGVGYCVAGRVAEAALGNQSFEKVTQDALFRPLGMTNTSFNPTESRPFILVGGSLNSTLDDMAVFGQMHLNDGVYNGKRILSEASVTEQRKLQAPKERFRASGLGWQRAFPDEDGLADLVFIDGASGPKIQVDRRRQTVTVFLVRTRLLNVVPLHKELNQYVEKMFELTDER
jgi:CubicO group peptidase (beta-lactamase class C family)